MRAKITDRCKVWEINDLNGHAEVKFSCSRKVKEGGYDQTLIDHEIAKHGCVSDYHTFVRFVGHAYNQLKGINIGDTITNLDVQISTTEPYWDSKNNCVAYSKNERITVFEFEKYNPEAQSQGASQNMDTAPQVSEEKPVVKPQNTPVQPAVTSVTMEELSADDECPF